MSLDPWDYYPGSKQLRRTEIVDPEPEDTGWDNRPVRKTVRGEEVEFFTIGAVAAALNKSVPSIRLWVRNGNIPDASFRLPKKGAFGGRRLYTRAQVEALISIADKHGIRDKDRVIWAEHPTFADEVREAWANLKMNNEAR